MLQVPTVLALAMTVLLPAFSSGQTTPRSARMLELLSLVGHHTPGQNDDAVSQLAEWPHRDLEEVSNELKQLVKGFRTGSSAAWRALEPYGVTSPETLDRLLERTALLHAEVAIFHRTEDGYTLPPDPTMQHSVFTDGRPVGSATGTFHWEAARRVLDLIPPQGPANADVLLWYQATTATLQWWNDYYELEPQMIRARERFPRDAVLLMYDGTVHENLAEPRVQNGNREQENTARTPAPRPCLRLPCPPPAFSQQKKPWFSSPQIEWRTAQALFEQSLKVDSGLVEARVRLARVLGLQDQHEAAVTQLKQALTATRLPRQLRYVALLLLGREEWTLGRAADAEAAYQEAAALYPAAQSPQLGLSQVAHHRGDRDQALAYLGILQPAPASTDRTDPWWTYSRIHVPDASELLTTLVGRFSK